MKYKEENASVEKFEVTDTIAKRIIKRLPSKGANLDYVKDDFDQDMLKELIQNIVFEYSDEEIRDILREPNYDKIIKDIAGKLNDQSIKQELNKYYGQMEKEDSNGNLVDFGYERFYEKTKDLFETLSGSKPGQFGE